MVLSSGSIVIIDVVSHTVQRTIPLSSASPSLVRLYCWVDKDIVVLAQGKTISTLVDGTLRSLVTLPEVALHLGVAFDTTLIALSATRFKLYAVSLESSVAKAARLLEAECTSFATHASFIVWTTLKSQLRFASQQQLEVLPKWDREMETGALMVACVPRGARTIVQAPRGSFETVYPRPLVMLAGEKLLEVKQYGRALDLFRKHKIDLSQLVTANHGAILDHLDQLVASVADADRLCLFLTQVGEGPCLADTINRVCEGVRKAVGPEMVNVVLTSLIQQKPSRVPEALSVVAELRHRVHREAAQTVFSAKEPRAGKDAGERALDYLTFLVPVESLFDEALGMYDFDLVGVVAKRGQKDPREYVPLLESLRRLSVPRMRHAVDVRLKRWSSALANLAQENTEEAASECMALVRERRLFRFALTRVWTEESACRRLCFAAYGDYLEGKGRQAEAGVCFARAGQPDREAQCAAQLGDWAWAVVASRGAAETMAEVAAVLESQHRWEELARMRAFPGLAAEKSSGGVAEALARAGQYSEAAAWGWPGLAALLGRTAAERASLWRGSAARFGQLAGRLRALRNARREFESRRAAERLEAGGEESETPSEYSQASTSSRASSTFSSGSSASSLATLAQGRAAQQARAAKKGSSSSSEARRLTGKPGSMHEEEWLHRELRALVPDEPLLRSAFSLLLALLRANLDTEATALQRALSGLIAECEAAAADMLAPCLLHGRGGLTYHQFWVPSGHLHTVLPAEHSGAPGVDQSVLTPKTLVPTVFQWKLILLQDEDE